MLRSYVGVVSRRGLVTLEPESESLVKHLVGRAAHATRETAVCLWAVLASEPAALVAAQVESGDFGPALRTLNQEAFELGPIYPS